MRIRQLWRRAAALLLSCALLTSGCATAPGGRLVTAAPPAAGYAAIVEFVQQLPLGTVVQIDRVDGRTVRGTLLKVSADTVTVQPRTRLPEPPVDIRLSSVLRVQPETGNGRSIGKAIGAGAAAGAGAALGVFLLLLAIFSD